MPLQQVSTQVGLDSARRADLDPKILLSVHFLDVKGPSSLIIQSIVRQNGFLWIHNYTISYFVSCITDIHQPFPNNPWFLRVSSTSLLKTLWEKKKLLVTSNFFFYHSVFYLFRELSAIFVKFEIVVCKLFQFERV